MRIDGKEHLKQNWRVQSLLPDLRVEDVWLLPIEMEKGQSIEALNAAFVSALGQTSSQGLAGWLFKLRFFLGRIFGWEDEEKAIELLPEGSIRKRYAEQEGLTSLGLKEEGFGDFVPVYIKQREMLSEIENKTVLAAAHFGMVPKNNDKYAVHMTVYVKPKGMFGAFYMQLIKPFRLWIVYPYLMKMIGEAWECSLNKPISSIGSLT